MSAICDSLIGRFVPDILRGNDESASTGFDRPEEARARPDELKENLICLKALKYVTYATYAARYGTKLIVVISAAAPHVQAIARNISTTLGPIFGMCFPLDFCINTFEMHNLYQLYKVGKVTAFEFSSELAVYLLSAAEAFWYTCTEVLKISAFALDTIGNMASLYGLGLFIAVIENGIAGYRMYRVAYSFRKVLNEELKGADDAAAKEIFKRHLEGLTHLEAKRYFSMEKEALLQELEKPDEEYVLDVKAVQIQIDAAVKKQGIELVATTLNTVANAFFLVAAVAPSHASPALVAVGIAIKVGLTLRAVYNLYYSDKQEPPPPIMILRNRATLQEA